jgi:DNA-binding transcriptional LysR family regulator
VDWNDLRYLLAVHKHGSLASASRALGVDQTTVGRRLNALQDRLATRLFERTSTGYRLTAAGERACAIGEQMEAAAVLLDREVAGRDAGVEGQVTITSPQGFLPHMIGALAQLRRLHQQLTFRLLVDTAVLNLLKGEADIAVRAHDPGQPSLLATRVARTPWHLYASRVYLRGRGSPKDGSGLAGHDVIAFDENLAKTPGAQWLKANAEHGRVVVRANNVLTALECCAADMGLTPAPFHLAARFPELRRVLEPLVIDAGNIYLVTHQDLAQVPRIRVTLDTLTTHLRATIDEPS